MSNPLKIYVYGAEVKCASCINLPSAKETLEWLEAAVTRKYPEMEIGFFYVDLHAPHGDTEAKMAQYIIDEDLFYPVVTLNDEIVAEGNPKLTSIYEKIEKLTR